jgi:hypothetical protein
MDLEEMECKVVDSIQMTQVRDQWRALVNTKRTFGSSKRLDIS